VDVQGDCRASLALGERCKQARTEDVPADLPPDGKVWYIDVRFRSVASVRRGNRLRQLQLDVELLVPGPLMARALAFTLWRWGCCPAAGDVRYPLPGSRRDYAA
jgi:hypothetical protein